MLFRSAPKISKSKANPNKMQEIDPLIETTIERLKKGREERQRVKKSTERFVDNSGMKFDVEFNKFKQGSNENSTKSLTEKEAKKISKNPKLPKAPLPKPSAIKNSSKEKRKNVSKKEAIDEKAKVIEDSKEDGERLYIDINLGDTIERIIVHKGDTAAGLTEKFATEHSNLLYIIDLIDEVKDTLKILIQEQINNLLDNIEEESDDTKNCS